MWCKCEKFFSGRKTMLVIDTCQLHFIEFCKHQHPNVINVLSLQKHLRLFIQISSAALPLIYNQWRLIVTSTWLGVSVAEIFSPYLGGQTVREILWGCSPSPLSSSTTMSSQARKALSVKVGELLDCKDGVEMYSNPHHIPSLSDVLLHCVHQQVSPEPPDKDTIIRLT